MTKKEALSKVLEISLDEIECPSSKYAEDINTFMHGKREYLVLTDYEADAIAKENILNSVWAFSVSFLARHTGLEYCDIETILSNDRFEGNNTILTRLILDLDKFVYDARLTDGRAHFMNTYDNEENEVMFINDKGKKTLSLCISIELKRELICLKIMMNLI